MNTDELVVALLFAAALAGSAWWGLYIGRGGRSRRELAQIDARFEAQEKARRGPCRDQAREEQAYRSGRAVLKKMGENQ